MISGSELKSGELMQLKADFLRGGGKGGFEGNFKRR
jgi:hypothetical protein